MSRYDPHHYVECPATAVPACRFDVLAHNQGQMVEVAWSAFGRAESGPGALFKRVTDRSDRSTTYYRRVEGKAP